MPNANVCAALTYIIVESAVFAEPVLIRQTFSTGRTEKGTGVQEAGSAEKHAQKRLTSSYASRIMSSSVF